MKIHYTYAIVIDGKISSLAFSKYKNARNYMVRKANTMNTFKAQKPIIEDYHAEYFYIPRNDINDPFKSGSIQIVPLDIHDMEEL